MAIEIDKRFTVNAPVERVWAFLTDLERVAECLEGAAVTGRDDEGVWSGTMKVKLGPVSSTYRGTVRFVRTDEAAHTAELSAEGRDTRGKGGADMTMRSELTQADGGTEVRVASTVNVTGVLARMGRGMIEDVSDQLFGRFTGCVRETLEGTPGESAHSESADRDAVSGEGPGEPGDEAPTGRASTARAPGGPSGSGDEALQLGGMGTRAVGLALGRTLRRPAFWVGVVIGGVLVWLLFGR